MSTSWLNIAKFCLYRHRRTDFSDSEISWSVFSWVAIPFYQVGNSICYLADWVFGANKIAAKLRFYIRIYRFYINEVRRSYRVEIWTFVLFKRDFEFFYYWRSPPVVLNLIVISFADWGRRLVQLRIVACGSDFYRRRRWANSARQDPPGMGLSATMSASFAIPSVNFDR